MGIVCQFLLNYLRFNRRNVKEVIFAACIKRYAFSLVDKDSWKRAHFEATILIARVNLHVSCSAETDETQDSNTSRKM